MHKVNRKKKNYKPPKHEYWSSSEEEEEEINAVYVIDKGITYEVNFLPNMVSIDSIQILRHGFTLLNILRIKIAERKSIDTDDEQYPQLTIDINNIIKQFNGQFEFIFNMFGLVFPSGTKINENNVESFLDQYSQIYDEIRKEEDDEKYVPKITTRARKELQKEKELDLESTITNINSYLDDLPAVESYVANEEKKEKTDKIVALGYKGAFYKTSRKNLASKLTHELKSQKENRISTGDYIKYVAMCKRKGGSGLEGIITFNSAKELQDRLIENCDLVKDESFEDAVLLADNSNKPIVIEKQYNKRSGAGTDILSIEISSVEKYEINQVVDV